MLKGTYRDSAGEVLVFGLSAENIKRLQEGCPMYFEIEHSRAASRVLIFSGASEDIMQTQIAEHGLPIAKQRELPYINRTEAEFLVELIEKSGGHRAVADDLRKVWGMGRRA